MPSGEHLASDSQSLEDLVEEYLEKLRSGERPSVEAYAASYPELADEIRELFPTMEAMENLKQRRESAGAGQQAAIPEQLGDFRILGTLGHGGMGVVYEAEQISLGRVVALKVLPVEHVLDTRALTRFQNEARLAAQLDHPAIVSIHSVGQDQGRHYFAMQRIQGASLGECLRWLRAHGQQWLHSRPESVSASMLAELTRQAYAKRTGLDIQEADAPPDNTGFEPLLLALGHEYSLEVAAMVRDAALALQFAHGKGVLHRDIKPGNLLLDREGRVYVADFGLARAMESHALTRTGHLAGTLRYMAPELFEDSRAAADDPRCDIYSLGVVLYEALCLQSPFARSSVSQLVRRILEGSWPPLEELHPGLPPGFAELTSRAMALNPADRYGSASEMARDLGLLSSGQTPKVPKPYGRLQGPPKKSRAPLLWALLLMALAAGALLGWQHWHGDSRQASEPVVHEQADPPRQTGKPLAEDAGGAGAADSAATAAPDPELEAKSTASEARGESLPPTPQTVSEPEEPATEEKEEQQETNVIEIMQPRSRPELQRPPHPHPPRSESEDGARLAPLPPPPGAPGTPPLPGDANFRPPPHPVDPARRPPHTVDPVRRPPRDGDAGEGQP